MGRLQRVQDRRRRRLGGVEHRGRSRCRGRVRARAPGSGPGPWASAKARVRAGAGVGVWGGGERRGAARAGLRRRDGGRESVGIWGKRGGMKRGVGILGVKWA